MITTNRPAAWLVLGVTAALLAGCGKSKDGAPPPAGGPPATGVPAGGPPAGSGSADAVGKLPGGDEYAAGKKVYADQNCAKCHVLGGTGGGPPGGPPGAKGKGGGMGGPDLTAAGASHDAAWLAAHVRDPKSHKPQSRMPASGPEKISAADLTALSEYLASRK